MDEHHIARDYDLVRRYMRSGLLQQAISGLRRILAAEPDDAIAHALLALCLLDSKRIHAALHEARIAVGLGPDLEVGQHALGRVLIAHRKLKQAEQHLQEARALAPEDGDILLSLAVLYNLQNRKAEQLAMIERARELDPESVDAICAAGQYALGYGDVDAAARLAREACELSPEDIDALVLMGLVHLRKGEIAKAREHAVWALQSNANDTGALYLLASIKARTSPLLGLWFRYNTWLLERGERGAIIVLIAMYLVFRVSQQLLMDVGRVGAAEVLSYAWIAFCIYTWVGPGMFQRALARELSQIELKPEF